MFCGFGVLGYWGIDDQQYQIPVLFMYMIFPEPVDISAINFDLIGSAVNHEDHQY